MDLKMVREFAEALRTAQKNPQEKIDPRYIEIGMVMLDDRITELETEIKRLEIIRDAGANNIREAWAGYQMIREVLEIDRVGAVKNGEYLDPPPFLSEAKALVQAITELETYVDTLRKQKEAADQRADNADTEVGRLMAQRDELLKAVKTFFKEDGKVYGNYQYIMAIIKKIEGVAPDKNLPKFKDIIGLFVDDAEGTALIALLDACKKAKQFIENGIENGYIHLPDKPDPALDTLPQICAAIAKTKGAALEENPKE